jgi:hypothetical protein
LLLCKNWQNKQEKPFIETAAATTKKAKEREEHESEKIFFIYLLKC